MHSIRVRILCTICKILYYTHDTYYYLRVGSYDKIYIYRYLQYTSALNILRYIGYMCVYDS